MLIKSPQLIFIFTLMAGTTFACSASSWMTAWIGLEINLMSFTPLLIKNLSPLTMELTIKYFLVQAMASVILLFSTMMTEGFMLTYMGMDLSIFLTISLAMKAGVAPFHFWFPQIMAYADWSQSLLILTWQKIAPLILISYTFNFLIPVIIMSSALVGMLGGLNQTFFKKILAYSSIIHSSWLISISYISDSMWWLYFLAYSLMTISIILPMNLLKVNYIYEINLLKMNYTSKLLIFINLLSLAGLPPFLGFFIKMASINSMCYSNFNPMLILILILASLIAFYFYSRLMYSSLLLNESSHKFSLVNTKMQSFSMTMLTYSLLGNTFISFMVLLA